MRTVNNNLEFFEVDENWVTNNVKLLLLSLGCVRDWHLLVVHTVVTDFFNNDVTNM